MTKDILTASVITHRGSYRLRTAAMCYSFKWMPNSQRLYYVHIVRYSLNIVMFVVLAFSVAVGIMKELRCNNRACFTENSATNAWNLNFNDGNFGNNNKTNENSVRPVSAFDRIHFMCLRIIELTMITGVNSSLIIGISNELW